MNRDEFISLPPAIALGVLYDIAASKIASVPAPEVPRPPRYDLRIYRKEGFQWASECDLRGLQYWQGRYQESASKGGQYAEKDQKRAVELDRWIGWRICNPTAIWTGTRGDTPVTAAPPADKPKVHASTRGAKRKEPEPDYPAGNGEEEYDEDRDELPF